MLRSCLIVLLSLLACDALARTLRVGPGAEYATPSAASDYARDGDTIEIAAGDYRGDVAVWNANRIRIVGVNGRPHLRAEGRDAQGKALWVIRGDDVVVENVEISGVKVPHRNGAAIRLEGRNFTLRDAYVHDNENGLLTGANPQSDVTIDHCEFARNGNGEGYTHNLYIGAIARLTVTRSYFHHAIVGHNLKSRAAQSVISDSRLADERDGRASYEADFPNGGIVTLTSNVFQKGQNAENPTLVSMGAEGLAPGGRHAFVARGNTFVSQRRGGTRFIALPSPLSDVTITGNVFAGDASLPDVADIRTNNVVQKDVPSNADRKPEGF